jgi:phosphoribosylformylglycinamidine cyclo-ligase
VRGIAEGCQVAGCALLGGEMAEHAGGMGPEDIDVAGFAVGVVEDGEELGAGRVREGDVLLGLASPGLRSNGYTLARHVFLERAGLALEGPAWLGASHSLADELLRSSVIYAPAVLAAVEAGGGGGVRAAAHITGGGIPGNLARVLPPELDAELRPGSWSVPRVFGELARLGPVEDAELARVTNLGLGMVLVVAPDVVDAVTGALVGAGSPPVVVGGVRRGSGRVVLPAPAEGWQGLASAGGES